MDKEKVRKLVEEYAKLVIENMIVNKIILYGSYARGNYREDSDIDVAIVVPRSSISDDIINDMAKLFRLRRNISSDIEPVLLIDEEDASGFLEAISEYGEVVYSRWERNFWKNITYFVEPFKWALAVLNILENIN